MPTVRIKISRVGRQTFCTLFQITRFALPGSPQPSELLGPSPPHHVPESFALPLPQPGKRTPTPRVNVLLLLLQPISQGTTCGKRPPAKGVPSSQKSAT